jgi:hypothetical protein
VQNGQSSHLQSASSLFLIQKSLGQGCRSGARERSPDATGAAIGTGSAMTERERRSVPRVQGPGGVGISVGATSSALPVKLRLRRKRQMQWGSASGGLEMDLRRLVIAPFWRVQSPIPLVDATASASSTGVELTKSWPVGSGKLSANVTTSLSVSYFGDVLVGITALPHDPYAKAVCSTSMVALSSSAVSLSPAVSLRLREHRSDHEDVNEPKRTISLCAPAHIQKSHASSSSASKVTVKLQDLCATLSL